MPNFDEWEDSRQREAATQRYLEDLQKEDKKACWVEQEWSTQDILVSVNQRFSTHVPLDMITIAYREGIVASHPARSGALNLLPDTARVLAKRLNEAADRADKETKKTIQRHEKARKEKP